MSESKELNHNQLLLMVLPKCAQHNIQMQYRKTEGEGESWGGVWYDCPECYSSVVYKTNKDDLFGGAA